MNAAVVEPMRRSFVRLIGRLLPWFDQAAWDHDRRATRRVLAQANHTLSGPDRIRGPYQQYANALRRR